MIGYDTSGLSTQQLDDGFRFMAEFLHPDDAPTLHLCIVNLINTSVAANIMPADFTGIYFVHLTTNLSAVWKTISGKSFHHAESFGHLICRT